MSSLKFTSGASTSSERKKGRGGVGGRAGKGGRGGRKGGGRNGRRLGPFPFLLDIQASLARAERTAAATVACNMPEHERERRQQNTNSLY